MKAPIALALAVLLAASAARGESQEALVPAGADGRASCSRALADSMVYGADETRGLVATARR
jgi:hypothetical protein